MIAKRITEIREDCTSLQEIDLVILWKLCVLLYKLCAVAKRVGIKGLQILRLYCYYVTPVTSCWLLLRIG